MEDEMVSFTTNGYMGDGSPDRTYALIWGLSELFPRVVYGNEKVEPVEVIGRSLMRERLGQRQSGARRIW